MSLPFFPSHLHWPSLLDRDRRLTWMLSANTLTGGRSMSGVEPKARTDGGGLWSATMSDVQVSSVDQVRTWRALAAALDGGATPIVLSVRDVRFAPWPAGTTDQPTANHSDDAPFSDLTPYVNDLIDAEVFGAAALRATSLTVHINIGAALKGGEYFSVEHDTFSQRLYQVAKVVKLDTAAPAVAPVTVSIASPGVVGWVAHGLVANQPVIFKTTGAMPTGLLPRTVYYVVGASIAADTFSVSATPGGAAINTSGTQSGVHRAYVGGLHTITIRPPLREAIADAKRVEFDCPKCVMQLASPDAMELALELRYHGQATVKFVESFPPWPGISA